MPLVEEDAADDALDRLIERRVGEDDVRRLAAELERELLARARERPLDALADGGRAGERDLVGTPACSTTNEPTSRAPVTMFTAPGGRSASSMIFARRSAVSGVVSAGLSTQVLPAASAGASFHAAMSSGKFHPG